MQEHMKVHRTKPKPKTVTLEETSIPWREVAAEHIAKYTEVGIMLKGCRYREGLTQKNLAEVLNLKQNHISEMENGKRTIGKALAKKFGEYFEIDYRLFL